MQRFGYSIYEVKMKYRAIIKSEGVGGSDGLSIFTGLMAKKEVRSFRIFATYGILNQRA
jgi:hypothetical protein